MIKSLTYNATKAIAEDLLEIGVVPKVFLQCKRVEQENGMHIIQEDGMEEKDIVNDFSQIVAYFRDLTPSRFEPAETDSCNGEKLVTTKVRFVIIADSTKQQSDFARKVLNAFNASHLVVSDLEVNQYVVIDSEFGLSSKDFFKDGATTGLAVDFEIKDYLSRCIPSGGEVCSFDDLTVC